MDTMTCQANKIIMTNAKTAGHFRMGIVIKLFKQTICMAIWLTFLSKKIKQLWYRFNNPNFEGSSMCRTCHEDWCASTLPVGKVFYLILGEIKLVESSRGSLCLCLTPRLSSLIFHTLLCFWFALIVKKLFALFMIC